MNLEPSAETQRRFANWDEQASRFLLPAAIAYEGDASLSEAVSRLRALAHPPVNMFAAEWTATVEENDLGLPFTVAMMRSYPRYRSGRRRRTVVLSPSNQVEGLLRHNATTGKTSINATIHFGSAAVLTAVTMTIGVTLIFLLSLSSTRNLAAFGINLAIWAVLLLFPGFQWARLIRDRFKLKRAVEGVVTNPSET